MKKLLTVLILVLLFVLSGCYSCGSYHKLKGTGTPPSWIKEKPYWASECKAWVASLKKPAPVPIEPKPAPIKPKPAAMGKCGPYVISRTFPSQNVLQLDKTMPKEVQLNAPFDYTIKVTNLTDMVVSEIVVTERLSKNFNLISTSSTTVKADENTLVWMPGSLGPKESKQIKVSGVAKDTQCLKHCATVAYAIPTCANVAVIEPKLRLEKIAPAEALLCDTIPIKLVITNPGTGTARNIRIQDKLPSGLRTSDGKTTLSFDVASLGEGQSREFSVNLKANKTGKYVNKATANAAGGIQAQSAPVETVVRQPVLAITKAGPEITYIGRTTTYVMEITNKGDAIAKNLTLEDTIPSGMKFVSANYRGVQRDSKVAWNLPNLAPGKSQLVEVVYSTEEEGTYSNRATAKATCADSVSASAKTSVKGRAAVLLEVIDISDPIELGSHETYVITATNQGTTDDTNIKIVCILEDTVEYYSSSGPTTASVKDRVVTFAPLPRLAPKTKATWKVVVKALKAGDVRFSVEMNTDQLTRPVNETEATEMYE